MSRLSIWAFKARQHWAVRGAAVIMAALAIEYVTQFGRSVTLSQLLSPTEFGIGSALVILWVLFDMSTGIGADRYLVQATEGGTPEALSTAHTVTLIRNGLSACLIAALAVPTAQILHVPQARDSFLWLAAIPLIRGFEHLGLTQDQRSHQFSPWALATGLTHVFGLIAVVFAAATLRDHRAVLCSLAAQAISLVASTHYLARDPYRLSFHRSPLSRALRFGLPLTINGLALAAIGQIDRLAVGSFLGVVQLGRYGLATMLFYLPVSLVGRILSATLTPRLSAAWHRSPRHEFPLLFGRISYGVALLGVLMSALVALAGNPVVSIMFGQAYRVEDQFFAILAMVVLMKCAKITLNFGGIAMGKTTDIMLSNIPGAFGLAVTMLGLMWSPHLSTAAAGALVGETLGTCSIYFRLKRHLGRYELASALPALMIIPVPCLIAAWCGLTSPDKTARAVAFGLAGLVVLVSLVFVPRQPAIRRAVSA